MARHDRRPKRVRKDHAARATRAAHRGARLCPPADAAAHQSTLPEKEALLAEARTFRAPDFLLLDGAEQLTTRQWLPLRVAIDALAGAVVTVHRTSRLATLINLGTSPELLDDLVAELTGGQLQPGEAAAILLRHRGDIRGSLRELEARFGG